jgi:hypothetical protein
MVNLYRLYQASPEEFCTELDKAISRIDSRLSEDSARVETLVRLQEEFLRINLSRQLVTEPATAWTYRARLPNRYFMDVFEPEQDDGGGKRWVGASGRLGTRLLVPRAVQYDFSVTVADFVSAEAERSFTLKIDGEVYPWLDTEGWVYSTVLLEEPASSGLDFELSVDPATIPQGRDVSFSFRSIDLTRRG